MGDIELMVTNISSKSVIYRRKVQQHLRNFDFKTLFVSELGWNILKESPIAMREPHSSRKIRRSPLSLFACSRQIARAVSSCSVANSVFFFGTIPVSGSPDSWSRG